MQPFNVINFSICYASCCMWCNSNFRLFAVNVQILEMTVNNHNAWWTPRSFKRLHRVLTDSIFAVHNRIRPSLKIRDPSSSNDESYNYLIPDSRSEIISSSIAGVVFISQCLNINMIFHRTRGLVRYFSLVIQCYRPNCHHPAIQFEWGGMC